MTNNSCICWLLITFLANINKQSSNLRVQETFVCTKCLNMKKGKGLQCQSHYGTLVVVVSALPAKTRVWVQFPAAEAGLLLFSRTLVSNSFKKMGTRKYSDIFGNCLTREGEEVQENISNLIKNFLGMGFKKEQEHVQNFSGIVWEWKVKRDKKMFRLSQEFLGKVWCGERELLQYVVQAAPLNRLGYIMTPAGIGLLPT